MRSLITVILLAFFINTYAQAIQPIEQTVGKLHVSIDPRIELLNTIQCLSDYRILGRTSPFSKDIHSYFSSFSEHKAVDLTNKLYHEHGFVFDAPINFILHLSQVPELKNQVSYSDYVIKRAGNSQNLEAYRKSIVQFAHEADFEKFWVSKQDFYNKVLEYTIAELNGEDLVKVVEDYFNEKQNSYHVIIAPLFSLYNYGPMIQSGDNQFDIYSVNTAGSSKNGIPYVSKESLYQEVCHEFGHSFVNPLTGKYIDNIQTSKVLFEPIKNDMQKQAYGDWSTCINEHIIRAINIRLQELRNGSAKSKEMLNREIGTRFVYVAPLVEKLKVYEKLRDSRHITFSEFYLQLLNVLDSLSTTDYLKLAETKFWGPINSVSKSQKIAWIYPTHDQDTASLSIVQDYVSRLYSRFKSQGSIMLADSTALKTNLSEYGLMVYGTIESNLLLSKYQETFPFKMKDHVLIADKEYKNEDLKFISCLPNPQNPQKGMAVYTAFSNRNINDINNVFHGLEDFVVFTNRENVISKSFYDKTEGWKFLK